MEFDRMNSGWLLERNGGGEQDSNLHNLVVFGFQTAEWT